MKKTDTINILLDGFTKIELLVTFNYEFIRWQEEGHGIHDFSYTDVDITYVELVIAGKSVDLGKSNNLLPFLTHDQINALIDQLEIH